MQNRILITGINGFAGRYLARDLFEHGYEIFGFGEPFGADFQIAADRIRHVDLRVLKDVRAAVRAFEPTHVVHLAAVSFVGHENVGEIYDTNIVGTRNLLVCLAELQTQPKAVLLTSSANTYGNSDKGVLSEDEPFKPANDYAVSKAAMEYMARQFAGQLNLITVRPFNYTGRGQSANFLVPKIVNHFRTRNAEIELGNIEVERDFSDVRTVVKYMRLLLETNDSFGNVYNICSGVAVSLKQIIAMCEQQTGHRITVNINPNFVRSNEVRSLIGSSDKLVAVTKFKPSISFADTLTWMLQPE